jgi:hypothetical protein
LTVEAHSVDRLLRAATGEPSPTLSDVLHGRRVLAAAISAAEAAPARRAVPTGAAWWRRISLATGAVAMAFAVVAVAGLLRPQPVTALGELAEVAEVSEATVAASDEYVYSRTSERYTAIVEADQIGLDGEAVAYVVPVGRQVWTGDAGVHEEVAVGDPEFLDPEVRAAYYASDLPAADGVGTTISSDYADALFPLDERAWSTDVDQLTADLQAYASGDGAERSSEAAVLDVAGDLLRDPDATPELRAALFSALEGMNYDVAVRESDRAIAVAVEYDDLIDTRLELVFDVDARLIEERVVWLEANDALGTPAGFVESEILYSPTVVVDSLDTP